MEDVALEWNSATLDTAVPPEKGGLIEPMKPTLLIVEDVEETRVWLATWCRQLDWFAEVLLAANTLEARALLDRGSVTHVLCDRWTPGEPSSNFCAFLSEQFPKIRWVQMSGNEQEGMPEGTLRKPKMDRRQDDLRFERDLLAWLKGP